MQFEKTITKQQKATGATKQVYPKNVLLDMKLIEELFKKHNIALDADTVTEAIQKAIRSGVEDSIFIDFIYNGSHYYLDMVLDRYIIRDRENCGKIKYFYHLPRQFRFYGFTAADSYYNRKASITDGCDILNAYSHNIEVEI